MAYWGLSHQHQNKTKQSKIKQNNTIQYKIEQSFKHLTKPHIATNNNTQKILGAGTQPAFISLICVLKFTLLLSAALFAFMAVFSRPRNDFSDERHNYLIFLII
jgi:hypothetical protein